jgi:Amidohydrolase family
MTAGRASTLIRGARVFDGQRLHPASNVLLADARARAAAAACAGGRLDFDGALRSVAALHQAGIPVLAGTDTNYPGEGDGNAILNAYTGHGITLHHELALLVRAGLSPAQALAAATSVPARLFGLTDRAGSPPGCAATCCSSTETRARTSPRPATSPRSGVTAPGCSASRSQPRPPR